VSSRPWGTDVSSAILYIGIVAIWAFVLVPRWLRRDQGHSAADADSGAEYGAEYADDLADSDRAESGSSHRPGDRAAAPDQPAEHAVLPMSPRSRAMQARRRLLTMLLTLTGGAIACFLLKLAPWWAVVPPAGMLGMYLLLLREASRADAERARRRHAEAARSEAVGRRAEVASQRAGAAARSRLAEPSAQVIDISARVGDQLYDQYADATIRAVGD
jgi:hypothetical protein